MTTANCPGGCPWKWTSGWPRSQCLHPHCLDRELPDQAVVIDTPHWLAAAARAGFRAASCPPSCRHLEPELQWHRVATSVVGPTLIYRLSKRWKASSKVLCSLVSGPSRKVEAPLWTVGGKPASSLGSAPFLLSQEVRRGSGELRLEILVDGRLPLEDVTHVK